MARNEFTCHVDVRQAIASIKNDAIKMQVLTEAVIDRTARQVERKAKELVPVDTGFLKESIQRDVVSSTEQTVTANTEYAGYVEYGTSRNRAYPFMRPAAQEAEDNIAKNISNEIKKIIREG